MFPHRRLAGGEGAGDFLKRREVVLRVPAGRRHRCPDVTSKDVGTERHPIIGTGDVFLGLLHRSDSSMSSRIMFWAALAVVHAASLAATLAAALAVVHAVVHAVASSWSVASPRSHHCPNAASPHTSANSCRIAVASAIQRTVRCCATLLSMSC